jgi:hypothetical protein
MARTPQGGRRRRAARVKGFVPPVLATLDAGGDLVAEAPPDPDETLVRVGILRPLDLVVLDVSAVGLRLDTSVPGQPSLIVAGEDPAQLIVRLPFQHLGEQAWPVELGPIPATSLSDHRAAQPSRLAFDVPAGTTIAFSSEGILAAMRTLPLRVVPAAQPRSTRTRPRLRDLDDVLVLPGGLALGRHGGQHVLARTRAPETPGGLATVLSASTTMRQARLRLGASTAVIVGTAGDDRLDLDWAVPWLTPRPRGPRVRAPREDETALEVPWRLILSPSALEGFTHADIPTPADDEPGHVELWHSRLGVRVTAADGTLLRVDEGPHAQRIVRAVWNRDRDLMADPPVIGSAADKAPVDTALTVNNRWALVRQSAETVAAGAIRINPAPVEAEQVTLSSLGTSLAVHGAWDTKPYTTLGLANTIASWDHIAPLGRDQFVKVVYPGYLDCTGHRWAWVTETERLIEHAVDPVARLRRRSYMVAIDDVVTYDNRDFPFTRVRVLPLRTPNLKEPVEPESTGTWIWPTLLSGEPFRFLLEVTDHAGTVERKHATLLWVNAAQVDPANPNGAAIDKAYRDPSRNHHRIDFDGQRVAYAPPLTPGDTTFETTRIHLRSTVTQGKVTPRLIAAEVVSPTARALTPQAATFTMRYRADYVANGFASDPGPDDPQLFADVVELAKADTIGHSAPATPLPAAKPAAFPGITFPSSERSGGFVKADQEIALLSRAKGTVGTLAPGGSPGTFDPATFLGAALPKLFGLFELPDVLDALGLAELPAFVTKTLGAVQGVLDDIAELRATVERAVADANQVVADAQAAGATAQSWAVDTKAQLEALATQLAAAVDALTAQLAALFDPSVPKDPDVIEALFTPIRTAHGTLKTAVETIPFPPALKTPLRRLVVALDPHLRDAGAVVDLVAKVLGFLDGLDPSDLELRARLDWSPPLKPWPDAANAIFSVRQNEGGGLTIAVELRVSATSEPSIDVLAELRRFDLTLFGKAALMAMHFERLAFQGGSARKPEVDVVFGGIEFLGPLSFIETLRQLIPFDGFSDPPFLDVSADGVRAGFTLALPNVAVGVFALSNISLGADCHVPFLGQHVSIGFNFCTRERPFSLTVMFVGGGGFVGIRAAPDGLELLEMSLEAGARLAVDLGIASGSVEVMVGVYLRLESKKGSLTGYFRIRGEVDVLGIISASIELLLELVYEFGTGKLVGRATLTIEVEVFMFSFSVSVSVERRLAGSNGDPTFAELMDVQPDATSSRWTEYCEAFAGV